MGHTPLEGSDKNQLIYNYEICNLTRVNVLSLWTLYARFMLTLSNESPESSDISLNSWTILREILLFEASHMLFRACKTKAIYNIATRICFVGKSRFNNSKPCDRS